MQNLLNGRTMYAAGPIEAVYDGGSGWRNELTKKLSDPNTGINGLRIWNPLIKPKWCTPITADDQRHSLEKFKDGPIKKFSDDLNKNHEIRETCLRLVSACDFIVCALGGPTVGSFEELAHAAFMKKPVLFLGGVDSCWRVAQFYKNDQIFFHTIDLLVEYLKKIDNGLQEVDNLSWIFLNNKWINHATAIR
jgi:hypothetical protein